MIKANQKKDEKKKMNNCYLCQKFYVGGLLLLVHKLIS